MAIGIQAIPRGARRRLQRMAQRSKDSRQVRRALAILQLFEGKTVSAVARDVRAARATVPSWRALYGGVRGGRLIAIACRAAGLHGERGLDGAVAGVVEPRA